MRNPNIRISESEMLDLMATSVRIKSDTTFTLGAS